MNHMPGYPRHTRDTACATRVGIQSLASAVMNADLLRKLTTTRPVKEIFQLLREHGMVELCNYNDHTIPVSLGALIEDQCKLSAALEMLRHHELRQVFSCLEDAGTRNVLVFKGTALAHSIYRDPWRRPRSGTAILVDHDALSAVINVLREIDYRVLPGIQNPRVSSQTILVKDINDSAQHMLDIHWQFRNPHVLTGCFEPAELLRNALPLKTLSRFARAPCTLDALLIAALYQVDHHRGNERLIWYYDVHLLIPHMSKADWESLPRVSGEKGIAHAAWAMVARAAKLFGSPVPPGFLNSWAARLPPHQVTGNS